MIIASPLRPDRRPTRRRLAGVALAATVLVALAGCAAPAASTGTGSASGSAGTDADAAGTGYTTPRTMPDGKGSGQPDGVFPRTAVHFAGTTAIPAAPQRVAVISTGQADSLLTLGIVPVASTAAAARPSSPTTSPARSRRTPTRSPPSRRSATASRPTSRASRRRSPT